MSFWLLIPLAAGLPLAAGTPAGAQSKTVSGSLDVPAGKYKAVRFRNAPAAGRLSVKLQTDGQIQVYLVVGRRESPDSQKHRGLYKGETADSLSFSVVLPAAGDYLLIADNRKGRTPRKVSVQATVQVASVNPNVSDVVGKAFGAMQARLHKAFMFDSQVLKIVPCGRVNAFSGGNTILLCNEMLMFLRTRMGSKDGLRDALLFTILHEMGHALLRQWGYPFYDNEEIADEFATAVMVMFHESEAAARQATLFAQLPPEVEREKKEGRFDRHPLSVQRARNIQKWLGDPNFAKKWQTILVPHMQAASLEQLLAHPAPWSDSALIAEELKRR